MYYELVLLDNFLIDYMVLCLSEKLFGKSFSLFKKALSALVGAVYALLSFFLCFLNGLFAKVLASFFICLMLFLPIELKRLKTYIQPFFRFMLSFYVSNMLLGGFVLFLRDNSPISYRFLVYSAAAVFLLFCWLGKRRLSPEATALLNILYENQTYTAAAFFDSGNLLKDADGAGVIIMDKECFGTDNIHLSKHFICKTVLGESVLPGFKPDKLQIKTDDGVYTSECLVAIGEVKRNAYSAILPANLNLKQI